MKDIKKIWDIQPGKNGKKRTNLQCRIERGGTGGDCSLNSSIKCTISDINVRNRTFVIGRMSEIVHTLIDRWFAAVGVNNFEKSGEC